MKQIESGSTTRRAFTLIEILVVLAIIAVLAAILLPVLSTVREKGRAAVCQSNLKQIGTSITMYTQDWEHFPRALDAADKYAPEIWASWPDGAKIMAETPLLPVVLDPYIKGNAIWGCPSDSGYDYDDIANVFIDARPTAYEKFGISYSYRTELMLRTLSDDRLPEPSETNVLNDANGGWHGSGKLSFGEGRRYNMLFADNHVKSVDYAHFRQAWAKKLPQ